MSYKEKALNILNTVLESTKTKLSKKDFNKLIELRELILKENTRIGLIQIIIRLATLAGIILDD